MTATNNPLAQLGEEIRKQGQGTSIKDLVFDPTTGEFRPVDKTDVVPTSGDIVTQMTEDGFAAAPVRPAGFPLD